MDAFLQISENGKNFRIPTKLAAHVAALKPLLNETAWNIFIELGKNASYPAQIAKKLGLHEQKVYYYINQLKNAGIIEVQKTEEMHGALAKFYRAKFSSFSLVPGLEKLREDTAFSFSNGLAKNIEENVREFLDPFIHNGKLSACIVIGSPDPHGPYKARARDTHLAVELAAFFGIFAQSFDYPMIMLDTMVPSLENLNKNLILVGGPVTNKLCEQLNEKMKLKFVPSGGHWIIHSNASNKDYIEDATGIIEKLRHPYFKDKEILVVAGKRNAGTKAAVVALIKNLEEVLKPNLFDENLQAKVVEGLDLDGDGIIDNAEIRE